jgi:beta-lactamase class A
VQLRRNKRATPGTGTVLTYLCLFLGFLTLVIAFGTQDADPRTPLSAASPSTTTTPSPSRTTLQRSREELVDTLDDYLSNRAGQLSVSVRDLATGFTLDYHPKLQTATASIVKVNILIALLLQAQEGKRELTATQRELATKMITQSDNKAATALWRTIGTGPGLSAANKQLGLRHTTPGPGYYWGTTTTSAPDQIRILQALTTDDSPLNASHRHYVLGLMGDIASDQSWGVSAGAQRGDDVALKNGWLPLPVDAGRWTINSIGRIRADDHDLLITVVSKQHPTMATGIETVEQVTRKIVAGRP